jgi:hypothetical protein
LDDGTARLVRRIEQPEPGKPRIRLELLKEDANGKTESISESFDPSKLPQAVLAQVDHYVPGPFGLIDGGWVDEDGDRYSLTEILELFPNARKGLPKKYRVNPFFEDLQIFFIETNRLSGGPKSEAELRQQAVYVNPRNRMLRDGASRDDVPRVNQYSIDIRQRIQSVLALYAKHSQESDRTFPERLVQFVRSRQHAIPESDILNEMAELEKKRQSLISFGLLDSESGLRDLTEEDVNKAPEALTIYVHDVQEKLKVFDDLAERIGSLMNIVNSRFKYKRLTVNRERGFSLLSDFNQPIDLENLSSGEQHELVVLYELLFRAPKNGLVLIDEPEISLHVGWQSRFLPDLIGILAVTDAYAIVATHSPVIIGTRQDLTVDLQGPSR